MLTNRGSVEAEITGLTIYSDVGDWWRKTMEEREGKLVFSQDDQTVWIILKYGRTKEQEVVFSFSKQELGSLLDLLEKEGDFKFEPKTGTGFLRIEGSGPSSDMKVKFPSGEKVYPQKKKFRRILQMMLSDLEKMYPEIAEVVAQITAHNTEIVWALVFSIGKGGPRRLARYRGNLTPGQVEELRRVAGVPSEMEASKSGEWFEFSQTGKTTSHQLLEVATYDHPSDYWTITTLGSHRFKVTNSFCNGRRLSEEELDHHTEPRPKAHLGDIFVFVNEKDQAVGSELSFEEMPLVEVFRAPERVGPFVHSEMIGKTAQQVSEDPKLREYVGLNPGDKLVCSRCRETDPSQYKLTPNDVLWVEKTSTEEPLFAFQAPNLIGSDGTDRFRPWAPVVIRRSVTGLSWPSEVLCLEVDGKNVTGASCSVKVGKGSKIKVVLRRQQQGSIID